MKGYKMMLKGITKEMMDRYEDLIAYEGKGWYNNFSAGTTTYVYYGINNVILAKAVYHSNTKTYNVLVAQ